MTRARFPAVLVVLLLVALAPAAFLSSYRLGVLALVVSYTIACLAQNLLSGYADVPSLGNVAFFATSAYVSGGLAAQTSLPIGVDLLGGVLAAGLLGLLVGLPALRITGMHLAIVTVALVFVVQEVMGQWNSSHNTTSVAITGPSWLLDERGLYVASVVVAGTLYLAAWNVLRSRSGRAILAGSENPYAALACGISTARYRLLAFVLSGTITGFAGAIYLYYAQRVTPDGFSLDLSVAFLTMMILGGTRSLGGSLLGALIIGLLPQFLTILPAEIDGINLQSSVYGLYAVLLLATLRYFPDGLWGLVSRAWAPDLESPAERELL